MKTEKVAWMVVQDTASSGFWGSVASQNLIGIIGGSYSPNV